MSVINEIAKIRSKNNKHWMEILSLAFKHAPKESKRIMSKIVKCDKEVTKLCRRLK